MKNYRNTIYVTIPVSAILLLSSLAVYYKSNSEFLSGILMGGFFSSILMMISAIIGYRIERREVVFQYTNTLNIFCVKLSPMYHLLHNSFAPERIDIYNETISTSYEFLLSNYHYHIPDYNFFIPNNKIAKLLCESNIILNDVYCRLSDFNFKYNGIKYGKISADVWINQYKEFFQFTLSYYNYIGLYERIKEINDDLRKDLHLNTLVNNYDVNAASTVKVEKVEAE